MTKRSSGAPQHRDHLRERTHLADPLLRPSLKVLDRFLKKTCTDGAGLDLDCIIFGQNCSCPRTSASSTSRFEANPHKPLDWHARWSSCRKATCEAVGARARYARRLELPVLAMRQNGLGTLHHCGSSERQRASGIFDAVGFGKVIRACGKRPQSNGKKMRFPLRLLACQCAS